MTEIEDRMDRLAREATAGVTLTDPSIEDTDVPTVGAPRPASGAARRWPLLAAAAVLVLVVGAALVALANQDPTERATTVPSSLPPSSEPDVSPSVPADDNAPVMSIVVEGRANGATNRLDVEVTVEGDAGDIAAGNLGDTETPVDGEPDRVFVDRGLVVALPGPGDYAVRLTGNGVDFGCSAFTASAGDRLVYVVGGAQLGVEGARDESGEIPCATLTTAEEWAGPSGDAGLSYVGLTEDEAVATADDAGSTTRVVGRDGIDFAVTADLVPTRLDLTVFDGVVVAARLGGEQIAGGSGGEPGREPGIDGHPVVVVPGGEIPTPRIPEGFVAFDDGAGAEERAWADVVEDVGGSPDLSGGLVWPEARPGPADLTVIGPWGSCTASIDVPEGGALVTIGYRADGHLSDGGECPLGVTTMAEYLGGWVDAWGANYDEATDYIGLTEEEAADQAAAAGVDLRVAARDGVPYALTDDLRPERVNVVLVAGRVAGAAHF